MCAVADRKGHIKGCSLPGEAPCRQRLVLQSTNKRRSCLTWEQNSAIPVPNSPGIERSALAAEAGKPTLVALRPDGCAMISRSFGLYVVKKHVEYLSREKAVQANMQERIV